MTTLFAKLYSLLMAILFAVFPSMNTNAYSFQTKTEACHLNLALISDTHIDYREYLLQAMLAGGMSGLGLAQSEIDALVVAGDITNYGDKKSVERFYKIVDKYSLINALVVASGNHEIGHNEGFTQEEAREYNINFYNQYSGQNIEKIYYSVDVNGYKMIVLGDEGDDTWDDPIFTQEQMDFLDQELSLGTAMNVPCFVICHWPIKGVNGERTVWKNGALTRCNDMVTEVLNNYQNKNVFFISGHLHQGIKSVEFADMIGFNNIETKNGINYINLPTYGLVSMFGIPWGGIGMMLEVYEDEVVVRPRNFVTGRWYDSAEVIIPLVS